MVAAALIVTHLIIRATLAFGGYFYWDDLILVGRAGTQPLLSVEYLFDDHDGHVMPGAFLVAGVISKAAPLVWFWPALSLVVLQLLATLALLRALHAILGWRPVLLIPLTFALFTPMAVPAFAWWAAALNSLPMLAALAWVCGDAVLLARTGGQRSGSGNGRGNRRYVVSGVVVFFGGLLFFEKAAVIPFVAFAVTALLAYVEGDDAPWRRVWDAGRQLWTAALLLIVVWIGLYVLVVDQQRWSSDLPMTWELLWRSVTHAIVPGLAGGPWEWQRWAPASPWGVPGAAVMTLGWSTLAAVLVVSLRRKRRIWPVWVVAVGYALACQVPIYLMRSSEFTALELAQTLRYLPDLVVVLALLAAVAFCAPNRTESTWLDTSGRRTAATALVAVGYVASSLFSTATYLISWRDNPTKAYLQNAEDGLARAPRDVTQLDQEVDPLILQRVAYPENLASHMFAVLHERPEFSSSTTELRTLASDGRLVDAQVTWVRTIVVGPVEGCGYLVQPDLPARMPLDGPLLPAAWTVELNYLANLNGTMTIALSEGEAVEVPVAPGLNRVFVRLPGAGDAITVAADTSALSLCLASGPVGYTAPR